MSKILSARESSINVGKSITAETKSQILRGNSIPYNIPDI
jgi:hypothetical protein